MIRKIQKGGTNNGMKTVYDLIRKMGVTSKYKGYCYVAEAINMEMATRHDSMKITKDIYPYLAKKFNSTPTNIEHDIRTVVNICWETNKKELDKIAGYTLIYKPTNSEFIDILAYYLSEKSF